MLPPLPTLSHWPRVLWILLLGLYLVIHEHVSWQSGKRREVEMRRLSSNKAIYTCREILNVTAACEEIGPNTTVCTECTSVNLQKVTRHNGNVSISKKDIYIQYTLTEEYEI